MAQKCKNISFSILIGVCVLLPIFFLPATVGGFGMVKGVILYLGVFLSTSFWLIAQFIQGSLEIPKSRIFLMLGTWTLLSLVSALTSVDVGVSLWGKGFVLDSFATNLVLALLVFMIATFTREQRRLVTLFLSTFAASVLTIVLQVGLYLSQNVPVIKNLFGHIANQGTLIGSWVDFTYFVTFTLILGLLMYEVLMPKGFFKKISLVAILLSLGCLVFLNFKIAWLITIAASLLVFVYKSSVERALIARFRGNEAEEEKKEDEKQSFPLLSFIALLVGLFFFLSTNSIGLFLSKTAGISFTNVRPSFETTTVVMRQALSQDPLFGAGAGSYADVWNMYRPVSINETIFWNTPFDIGFNYVQSIAATNGLLPILAFLVFLFAAIIHGFKLFNYAYPDRFSRFIAVTALIITIALSILLFFGAPGLVLIAIGFLYIGMLFGVSSLVGKIPVQPVSYLKDPRSSFFAILIIVIATMVGFSAAYFSGSRFMGIVFYNKALRATQISQAEKYINQALALSENDEYWRARTALYINEFRKLATTENPDKTRLQALFTQAEQSARAAVAQNGRSATNWVLLSQVYQLVAGGGGNAEALANAKNAAVEAQERSPNSPFLWVNTAQAAVVGGETAAALSAIEKALELKRDYLEAYILKGQIKEQTQPGALKAEMLNYTTIAPFNPEGHLVLGNLYLDEKNYDKALESFARAKTLAPTNPSGYLSYISTLEASGDKIKAVEELKRFKQQFPSVTGVEEQIQRINKKEVTSVVPETSSVEEN